MAKPEYATRIETLEGTVSGHGTRLTSTETTVSDHAERVGTLENQSKLQSATSARILFTLPITVNSVTYAMEGGAVRNGTAYAAMWEDDSSPVLLYGVTLSTGTVSSPLSVSGLGHANDIAVAADGELYIAMGQASASGGIARVNASTGAISGYTGPTSVACWGIARSAQSGKFILSADAFKIYDSSMTYVRTVTGDLATDAADANYAFQGLAYDDGIIYAAFSPVTHAAGQYSKVKAYDEDGAALREWRFSWSDYGELENVSADDGTLYVGFNRPSYAQPVRFYAVDALSGGAVTMGSARQWEGGTLSDKLRVDWTERSALIGSTTADSLLRLSGGTTVGDGALLDLYGETQSTTTKNGMFQLFARTSSGYKSLAGYIGGTLNWDGQPLQTSSDATLKQDATTVPDADLDAWAAMDWQRFRYREDVAQKGQTARYHTGLLAQNAIAAITAAGGTPLSYGIFCKLEDRTAEDGTVVAGKWSVRYDEALAMEAAYLRREVARLKARLDILEARDADEEGAE